MKNRKLIKELEREGLKIVKDASSLRGTAEIQYNKGSKIHASILNYGRWFSKPALSISPGDDELDREEFNIYRTISRIGERLGLYLVKPEYVTVRSAIGFPTKQPL